MLRSMTGYAAASGRRHKTAVSITVKSVNHRFLDLHLRLPPELEPLEPKLRRAVRDHLSRGHLEVTVMLERDGGLEARIDHALVGAYLQGYNRLRSELGLTAEPDLNVVLRIPGVLNYAPAAVGSAEAGELEALVLETLSQALERLDAMRGEEARAMAVDMASRLEEMGRATDEIEQLRAGAGQFYRDRLGQRLGELLADHFPPERLAQEAALLVERSDVSEELLRLKSHQGQFQALLSSPGEAGQAGKRLDFLLQEMGREVNSILSKTSGFGQAGLRITSLGLQVKAEIEKLREQVQNLQ